MTVVRHDSLHTSRPALHSPHAAVAEEEEAGWRARDWLMEVKIRGLPSRLERREISMNWITISQPVAQLGLFGI